jgi:uncharacterized protein (TIGR02391 family)
MNPFDAAAVASIARVLGDTETGMTNTEIGRLLAQLGINDPRVAAEAEAPSGYYVRLNKRDRITSALADHQRSSGAGDVVIRFIKAAMAPVSYTDRHDVFANRQGRLNEVLSSVGLEVRADGQVARLTAPATTVDQMAARAGLLTTELKRRSCHPKVTKYCNVELLRKSNFHAAEEAVKGLFDRLREETGSRLDGGELIDEAFAFKGALPVLALSQLSSKSELSEQSGFMNLLKGLYGMYRNPLAHDTRAKRNNERPISDVELLGLLTTVSLAHEHFDRCHHVRDL